VRSNLLLSINDLYGALICLLITLWIFQKANKHYYQNTLLSDFKKGFYLRAIGIIASAFFNLYLVKADSANYFAAAKSISATIKNLDLSDYEKILTNDFYDLPLRIKYFFTNSNYVNQTYDNHKTLVHAAGIIGFFSFDSYIAMSFFFSMWGYLGTWLLYITLIKKYPAGRKWLFYFIIAYPSLCFWTTGLLKDSICFGSLGILFYCFFNLSGAKKRPLFSILIGLISLYILVLYKTYILIAFSVAYVMGQLLYRFFRTNMLGKAISIMTFGTLLFFIANFSSINFERSFYELINKDIKERIDYVTGFQLSESGSSYDLGEIKLNSWGLIEYLGSSIHVTLFRPYIWEYRNPLVIALSFESMIMFFWLFYLIIAVGPKNIFWAVKSSSLLIFALFFTVLIASFAGGIAFNFGTLARYKLPLIPFYYFLMIAIPIVHSERKRLKNSIPI
jgi:hypothetical protein